VAGVFENGTKVRDAYSGIKAEVVDGNVSIASEYDIILLEALNE
jgi:alpha-amylase